MDRQCSSCGGFCKKSGCERENVKPEQKPVAWRSSNWSHSDADYIYRDYDDPALLANGEISPHNEPLYTAPPQREWVGLTGEELQDIYQGEGTVHFKLAMAEAKLKEKNT